MKAIDILKKMIQQGIDNSQCDLCDTIGVRDLDTWLTYKFRGTLILGELKLGRRYLYSYADDFASEAAAVIRNEWDEAIWLVLIDD